jgi:hypothetical protein
MKRDTHIIEGRAMQLNVENLLNKFMIYGISFIMSFLISLCGGTIASSVVAWLYSINEGVPLHELSEDYGMGMLVMTTFLVAFAVMLPICYFFVMKIIKYTQDKNYKMALLHGIIPIVSFGIANVMGCLAVFNPLLFPVIFFIAIPMSCFFIRKPLNKSIAYL